MIALSETSPGVTDKWVLPHRICDTHIGQDFSSITPCAHARPLLQLHRTVGVWHGAGFSDHSVIVRVHPHEIDHGESKLDDCFE